MEKEISKKHHHRIVPVGLIVLGIPIALVVGFLLVANIFFHDEKPPDDSGLRLSDIVLSDDLNAYAEVLKMDTDFKTAAQGATQPYVDQKLDDLLNGGVWDEAYAIAQAVKFASARLDFSRAANIESYQGLAGAHPNSINPNSFSEGLYNLRHVAKYVALEALHKAKDGNVTDGLNEASGIIRLGHHIEQSQATLIEWLIGNATKQIGLSALRQIGLQAVVTAGQAKTVSQDLEVYRDARSGLVTAMKMEYAYSRSYTIQQLDLGQVYDGYFLVTNAEGKIVPRSTTGKYISTLDATGLFHYYYWPNQSWRFLVDRRMQDLQSVQADCATGNMFPSRTTSYSRRTGLGRLLEPNTIGKLIADIGNVELGSVVIKACNESLAVSAAQTTLAISAYQKDNQKLPAMLDALVPEYLSSVPIDPYSGPALKYLPAKKIVYSVGPNRQDIGGETPSIDWAQQKNPTFAVGQ